MSRKGIIFSLIAIGLAGLFILLFSSGFTERVDSQNAIVRTRVTNLDETIDEFYTYAEVAQEVAGQQALLALYDVINGTGMPPVYLADFNTSFVRCLQDSTGCSNDNSLEEFLDNYTEAVKDIRNADLSYTVNTIDVAKESYWSFIVQSNISVFMDDRYAEWRYSQIVESRIPTTGAYDPAFLQLSSMYNGGTRVERQIATSPFNKKLQTINLSVFMDFYTIGQYQFSDNGSCLSQRFEGDFGRPWSKCGIESVLDPDDFPGLLLPGNEDIVHLDWQALNGETYPCTQRYIITSVHPSLTLWWNDTLAYGVFPPHSVRCS